MTTTLQARVALFAVARTSLAAKLSDRLSSWWSWSIVWSSLPMILISCCKCKISVNTAACWLNLVIFSKSCVLLSYWWIKCQVLKTWFILISVFPLSRLALWSHFFCQGVGDGLFFEVMRCRCFLDTRYHCYWCDFLDLTIVYDVFFYLMAMISAGHQPMYAIMYH